MEKIRNTMLVTKASWKKHHSDNMKHVTLIDISKYFIFYNYILRMIAFVGINWKSI